MNACYEAASEHVDRLENVGRAWKLIRELMSSDGDLNIVDRDNFAWVLDFCLNGDDKSYLWKLVTDLLVEDAGLGPVDRDNFCVVLHVLNEEFESAHEALNRVLRQGVTAS